MDFLAGSLELLACWMIGNKNRKGFIVFILGNIFWFLSGWSTSLYGLMITSIIFSIINIRNFIKWRLK